MREETDARREGREDEREINKEEEGRESENGKMNEGVDRVAQINQECTRNTKFS